MLFVLNSLVWEYLSILDLETTWNNETSTGLRVGKSKLGSGPSSALSDSVSEKWRQSHLHSFWEAENGMMFVEAASRVPDRICTREMLVNSESRIRNISWLDKQNKGLIIVRELGTLVPYHSRHHLWSPLASSEWLVLEGTVYVLCIYNVKATSTLWDTVYVK